MDEMDLLENKHEWYENGRNRRQSLVQEWLHPAPIFGQERLHPAPMFCTRVVASGANVFYKSGCIWRQCFVQERLHPVQIFGTRMIETGTNV